MNSNIPFNKGMIVRTVILFLAWLNQFLVVNGYSPFPFDDAQVEMGVSLIITFAASVWTWWKNNALTRDARKAEELAKRNGLK